MEVPQGFNIENNILKLEKSPYGLKQAPFTWNKEFTNFFSP